jgi:hypothetical protein
MYKKGLQTFLNLAKNKDCRKRYIHRIDQFLKSKTIKNIEAINFEKQRSLKVLKQ